MKSSHSNLRRLVISALLFVVLVVGIVIWSSGEAEARVVLETSYASSSRNWCHPLAQENSANNISVKLSEMTGEATSPLLSMTLIGLFKNVCTDAEHRELLPWYYQLNFLLSAIAILIVVTVKDTLLTPLGAFKKPVDALGEVVHIASGIIALPIATTYFSDSVSYPIADSLVSITNWITPAAYATSAISLTEPSTMFLFAGKTLGTGLGLVVFATTWVLSNVVEVLIFLSPIPFVDTILKTFRTSLIAGLMSIAYLNPFVGAIASLLIILLAARMFGYSFRLLTFGFVYCGDFLRRKWRENQTNDQGILAFSGQGIVGTKIRSIGRIYQEEESLVFVYYPLLIFPPQRITINLEKEINVVRGLASPVILKPDPLTEKSRTLFRLPPRYRNQEVFVGMSLNLPVNQEINTRRRKGGLFNWLSSDLD
jgi:hypothetical protein